MKRLDSRISGTDHALAMVGAVLSTFAAGMSVESQAIAVFFALGCLVTGLLGYLLGTLIRPKPWAHFDGYLWTFFGLVAFTQAFALNRVLPDGGFPFQLIIASVLCWMSLFGLLVSWRDTTLLFMSLPSFALFGLVGTFDTFPPATFMFFTFLVCTAVLYARMHQRNMLMRAKWAGNEEPELLRRDAWKWMAGPEWALASAGGVILFAAVSAPLVQMSLRDVTGAVRVALPANSNNISVGQPPPTSDVRVGQGPISDLNREPLFKVEMEDVRLLRDSVLVRYTGQGWGRLAMPESLGGLTSPGSRGRRYTRGELPSPQTPVPVPGSSRPSLQSAPTPAIDPSIPSDEPIHPAYASPSMAFDDWGIARSVERTMRITALAGRMSSLYAPGPIVEVKRRTPWMEPPDPARPNAPRQERTDAFIARLPDGRTMFEPGLRRGQYIELTYLLAHPSLEPGDSVAPPGTGWAGGMYLDNSRVRSRVIEAARRATRGIEDDYAKAQAIKQWIEGQVSYNIRARATPRGIDPVEYFLFESREGYCDLFASAMTLMARSVGLHARYVTGWAPDPNDRDGNAMVVRPRDYHAWAEIYFENVGWVIFDPTEGAPVINALDGARTAWWERDWLPTLLNTLAGLALVGAIAVLVLPRFGGRLISRVRLAKWSSERSLREDAARSHAQFVRLLEKHTRSPRRFSQTTREYVEAVSDRLGEHSGSAIQIAERLDEAYFARREPRSEDVARMFAATKLLAVSLKEMRRAAKRRTLT